VLGGQVRADRDPAAGRRLGEILGRRAWRCARRPRRRRLVLADQVGADRDHAAGRRLGEILGRGPGAARRGLAAGGWRWAASSSPIVIMLKLGGRARSSAGGPGAARGGRAAGGWRWAASSSRISTCMRRKAGSGSI
jgi:hypothetical protein